MHDKTLSITSSQSDPSRSIWCLHEWERQDRLICLYKVPSGRGSLGVPSKNLLSLLSGLPVPPSDFFLKISKISLLSSPNSSSASPSHWFSFHHFPHLTSYSGGSLGLENSLPALLFVPSFNCHPSPTQHG